MIYDPDPGPMSVGPTPTDLTDMLDQMGTDPRTQNEVTREVNKLAAIMGRGHMDAVADWAAKWADRSRAAFGHPSTFDPHANVPIYLHLDVSVGIRVQLEGAVWQYRQDVDPWMWTMEFTDPVQRESFLQHFIKTALGALAAHDDKALRFFLKRVFVVTPEDAHDTPVCRESHAEGFSEWPRCLDGVVLSELPGVSPVPGAGASAHQRFRDIARGVCPCRCHPFPAQRKRLVPGLGWYR